MALRLLVADADPGASTARQVPEGRAPDALVARAFRAEREYGYGQRLQVCFERLRFVAGRLHADILVTREGRTAREAGVAIAGPAGFLTGGGLPRDDGTPDLVHRAVVRRLADVPLLDVWLDRLLGEVEERLLELAAGRADWLGPATHCVRLDPLTVPLGGRSGLHLAAEDLRHDGALHGSLRLRLGTRLVARCGPTVLVEPTGRFSTAASRALRRALPWRLALRHGGALREALAALAARLGETHRLLCAGEPAADPQR